VLEQLIGSVFLRYFNSRRLTWFFLDILRPNNLILINHLAPAPEPRAEATG
jgi:hypothetical protein